MRRYETIYIVDPDLSEDGRKQRLEKNKDLIKQMGGVLIEVDDWGNKRLAYEIKKKFRGHYIRLDYCGGGELVNEMERHYRIDDKYIKFMTIVLEEKANPESILAEKQTELAAKEKAEAEAKLAEETKLAEEAEAKVAEKEEATEEPVAAEQTESNEEDK